MIRVRTATLADLPAIQHITAASATAPQWTEVQIRESIAPPTNDAVRRTILVAQVTPTAQPLDPAFTLSTDQSEIAGFAVVSAMMSIYPVEAELESIAVAPKHRGQGAGALLLQAAEGWICSLSPDAQASVLRLEVRGSNTTARRLYERNSFRRTAVRPGYYTRPTEDAICMEKIIGSTSA